MTDFEQQLETLRARMMSLIEAAEGVSPPRAGEPAGRAADEKSGIASGQRPVPLARERAIAPASRRSARGDPLATGREAAPADLIKRQDDEATAIRVKVICTMTRAVARCVGFPQQFHPEWVEAETRLYEERKREAIALAESITSETLRQQALEQVLGFCVEARDMREAERLMCKVSDTVRKRVISGARPSDRDPWSGDQR